MQALQIEREATRRLPALLAELLGEESPLVTPAPADPDEGVDLTLAGPGRTWLFQAKTTSRPGTVTDAARRLLAVADAGSGSAERVAVLVVPYMSQAGARAADQAGMNWLDLSGNASIRARGLRVYVRGRRNAFPVRGRPSSPFAPRSARVARTLMLDPSRWWRQKDLVTATGLDDSQVSRVVRRLLEDRLVSTRGRELRPAGPGPLLDAWADDYRFDRHDAVLGHVTGSGMEVARRVADHLAAARVQHAFTGLAAAWAIDHFATFRLTTVYVDDDPRDAADALGVRLEERGANLQVVCPDDPGVFAGKRVHDQLPCVSPAQVYLDLQHLPERAHDAADHLWKHERWSDEPA